LLVEQQAFCLKLLACIYRLVLVCRKVDIKLSIRMKICPFCKKTISKNSDTCPHCQCVLVERIHSSTHTHHNVHQNAKTSHHKQFKNYFKQLVDKLKKLQWNSFKKYIPILALAILIVFISSQEKTPQTHPYQAPVSVIPNNEDENVSIKSADIPTVQVKDPKTYISLSNGTSLSKNSYYFNGLGELKIENGTSLDAIAKLVNITTNKSIFTVYIKANSTYSITKILDGDYKLFFNLGNDWDSEFKAFTINSGYEVFEELFDFVTSKYTEGDYINTEYSMHSVTLNPVIGGQARTNEIDAVEFGSY